MNWGNIIDQTTILEWILLGLFLVSIAVQFGFYFLVYRRFVTYTPSAKRKTRQPVSVIICARNEEKNLKMFLPKVLEQDYPEFEVVVVNDSSTDGTEDLLAEFKTRYKHLRYTSIPLNEKFKHGKKLAVTIGIKASKYDRLVLTDADCYPVTDQWLQIMASHLTGEHQIVLGYGGYERRKGILNVLIRYETVFTAMQYFSHAIAGKPFMGVGRNLAYRKELFFESRGFSDHYHLASGDDDLFVNQHAHRSNTAWVIQKEGHTRSVPERTFRNWIHQKQRHLSAGNRYRSGTKLRLASEYLTRMLVYILLVLLCVISPWRYVVLGLFVLLLISRLIIFKMGMRSLDEKYLLLPSLLLDPILPLVLGIIWVSGAFVTKYQPWN
jgi:cellulose synthase/poly-beta-1,6-N-acetylglucosamine synthase-like glycosyltransferase